jgi:thiol-disulfide isomerase/thioredoxin
LVVVIRMKNIFKKVGLGIVLIPLLIIIQLVTEVFRFQILNYIDYQQYALTMILICLISFVYLAHFFTRFTFFTSGLKTSLVLFFLPYSLLLVGSALLYDDFQRSRLLDIVYLALGGCVVYWLYNRNWTRLKQQLVLACFATFMRLTFSTVHSYLFFAISNEATTVKTASVLKDIQQLDGSYLNSTHLKGKLIVLDMWNKSCGNCISGMPKLDTLTQHYKNDTSIIICSVYGSFSKADSLGWYKSYIARKFNNSVKYCFIANEKFDSLKLNLFPVYFIIDKQGNCTKHTQLSMDENNVNSIYSKIDDLKNEY